MKSCRIRQFGGLIHEIPENAFYWIGNYFRGVDNRIVFGFIKEFSNSCISRSSDSIAYLACDEAGFVIIDIAPLDTASVQFVFPLGYLTFDVTVNGNFAYVTGWAYGLRIFRLQ
jgi:hypothetical protein